VGIVLVWDIQRIDARKEKDGKTSFVANNYLEVLVDDEKKTLEQLNFLCGAKHDFFRG
jgi:hypothetical protein